MTRTRKCGKKTKSRVSRNKRNRRVSRKQKGGDRSAVLRKNGKDKDIKKYTLTDTGIEWVPGTKTKFKGLFGTGSQGIIRYSDILSLESIRKVSKNLIEVDTSSKTYRFDNKHPCKNKKTGERCVGKISLDGFFKTLVRKWTEHNTGVRETALEALARYDRDAYGLDTRADYGLVQQTHDQLPRPVTPDWARDPIADVPTAAEAVAAAVAADEAESRAEGSLRGGRKHKNKSRKCRKTKKTRRTRKTRKARRKYRR